MKLMQNTRVRFIKEPHSYYLDEVKKLKGVTSLMQEQGLSADYSGIKEDMLNAAAERGRKVHQDIEDYCNGKTVAMTKELKAYIRCGVVPVANEYLVSDNEMIASCIDIVAYGEDNTVNLIDIKTTRDLYIEPLRWQLSIYKYLFGLQNPDIKVDKLYALHIKNSKAKVVEIKERPQEEVLALLEAERNWEKYTPKTKELSMETQSMLSSLEVVSEKIALIKLSLKEAEDLKKEIEQRVLLEMEQNGLKTLENGPIKVTYVAESERESVDKTRLQNDLPELYEKYKKVTIVAPSVRVTIKK